MRRFVFARVTLDDLKSLLARLLRASALFSLPVVAAAAAGACETAGDGGPEPPTEQCFDPVELGAGEALIFDAGCPSMAQANADQGIPDSGGCGQIVSDATYQAGQCCYEVQSCSAGSPQRGSSLPPE
jgi:hypothetical protein